jgi:hypothetical protein
MKKREELSGQGQAGTKPERAFLQKRRTSQDVCRPALTASTIAMAALTANR